MKTTVFVLMMTWCCSSCQNTLPVQQYLQKVMQCVVISFQSSSCPPKPCTSSMDCTTPSGCYNGCPPGIGFCERTDPPQDAKNPNMKRQKNSFQNQKVRDKKSETASPAQKMSALLRMLERYFRKGKWGTV